MDFGYSAKTEEYRGRVAAFMGEHIYPNEERLFGEIAAGDRWQPMPFMEELKDKAKAAKKGAPAKKAATKETGSAKKAVAKKKLKEKKKKLQFSFPLD